jgi:NADH-quinone oxidoreductase subunit I
MAAVAEVLKEGVKGAGSLVKGLTVTMTNFWRTARGNAVTRRYGEDQHPETDDWMKERFRGLHGLTYHPDKSYDDGSRYENCIGCLACAKVCPDALITMVLEKRAGHSGRYPVAFQIDLNPCCMCGLCSEACPTPFKALLMTREFEIASTDRADLILTKDRLMELGDREFERLRHDHSGELTEEISYKGWARSEGKQEKRDAVAEKRTAGEAAPAAKKVPAKVAPKVAAKAEAAPEPTAEGNGSSDQP